MYTSARLAEIIAVLLVLNNLVSAQNCQGDQHECLSGLCIPNSQTCDMHNDCGDDSGASDESSCFGTTAYDFCWELGNIRSELGPCKNHTDWLTAEQIFPRNGIAIYTFTAPRGTTSGTTYLNAFRVNKSLLPPSNYLTMIVYISLPGSSQESVLRLWVGGGSGDVVQDDLRVPLGVDPEEIIFISMQVITTFNNVIPINNACMDCVYLQYVTYSPDCDCTKVYGYDMYGDWKSTILIAPYILETTCGVTEYNNVLFPLYDKCLLPARFDYVSPDFTTFVGDVVTLKCIATGGVPPFVEWRDENMNTLEAGLSSAQLKVVVGDSSQRFVCVLDNVTESDKITVEKWGTECQDIYFNRGLKDYHSGSPCQESFTTTAQGELELSFRTLDFNFRMNMTGIARSLSITLTSDVPLSYFVPFFSYEIQISTPGNRFLRYYHKDFNDGYSTFEKLNDTAFKLNFELVPPFPINFEQISLNVIPQTFQATPYDIQDFVLRDSTTNVSASLTTLTCDSDDCDEFFEEWSNLEAEFQESGCGDGLQQKYQSYLQCKQIQILAPSIRPAPSSISVPLDAYYIPFALECPIDNAVKYEWYRSSPFVQREFLFSWPSLIFPSFNIWREQGLYVCTGTGGGIYADVTLEYQALVTTSDMTTLKATMTLINETFTDDLSNSSSDAFSSLSTRIQNEVENAVEMLYSKFDGVWVYQEVSAFYPGSVVFDLMVFVSELGHATPEAEFASTLQSALFSLALNNSRIGLDPDSLIVVTLSSCPHEVIVVAGRSLTFAETRVGEIGESLEYCASSTNQGLVAQASRSCSGDFNSSAYWQDPVMNECSQDVNDQLDALKNTTVTPENVDQVADELVSLTDNPSAVDGEAVSLTADILDNIVNIRDPSPEVTADVVNVVNNLLQVDDEKLNEAPNANSSSRVIRALENQISYVLADGENFTGVTSSLAVKAQNIPTTSLVDGVGFASTRGENRSDPLTEDRISLYFSDSVTPVDQLEASIELPKDILTKLPPASGSVPITFILYQNSKLFRSKRIREAESTGSQRYIGSSIISATVVNVSIEELPADSPVASSFILNQRTQENQSVEETIECVFWDFRLEDGIGDWSTEGCRRATSSRGRALCHCDHATSFAVLVNIHGQKFSSLALDIISKIGCGVSIVALALTIIIYLAIKSLREKTAGRILISFSLSLLCLYVVFLAGVEQTSSRVGCIIVAVLLHYFALTSVAWMGVEAVNLYLKLVKVFNANVPHFMTKASVMAWGLPMVVVAVVLAVDYKQYENDSSCFLKPGNAFYYGQLLIIGLLLIFNTIIFILVTRKLTCKATTIQRSSERSKQSEMVKRLQNMVAISVLLGLTWVFGLLSVVESSNFAFQILFCVFNSLQGLFIFLFFVVRQDKIREYLRDLLPGKREAILSSSTSKLQLNTATKDESSANRDQNSDCGSPTRLDDMKLSTTANKNLNIGTPEPLPPPVNVSTHYENVGYDEGIVLAWAKNPVDLQDYF